jgi:hypothetical protein
MQVDRHAKCWLLLFDVFHNWNLTTQLRISDFMKIRLTFLELHENIQVNRHITANFHNEG